MKKLLLPLVLSLLPLTSMAVGIQSNGTDSATWGSNADNTLTAPMSLESNPGNIFGSITFALSLYANDSVAQTLKPYSGILIAEFSNDSVFISDTFLRLDSVVDGNLTYDVFTDASAQGAWLAQATEGTDNYLGVQFLDTNLDPHYGWMQFELNLFSNGVTAVRFISGDVTNAANEAATTGTGTVPEPSTVALLVAAVTGMALLGRTGMRQKK